MKAPTLEQITSRAYELWEQAGKPAGRDEEFYLQAEQELQEEFKLEPPAHYRVSNHRFDIGRWSGLPVQLSFHTTPTRPAILLRQMTSQHQNV